MQVNAGRDPEDRKLCKESVIYTGLWTQENITDFYKRYNKHFKTPAPDRKTGHKMNNLSEAKIYVGTYKRYNNGSLAGAWLDLSDYSDKEEFLNACHELHNNESDPEFMFQDWENIPDCLISESYLSGKFFELRDALQELSDDEQNAFFAWLEYYYNDITEEDPEDLINDFHDGYIGKYNSEKDFAFALIDRKNDLSDFVKMYFDYDAYARDIFINEYIFEKGYVFLRA